MKNLIVLLSLFLPFICLSQEYVSIEIYGFNMPIELDMDTTYFYKLNNNYCTESLFGVDENGGCSYMSTFPYLYFYHEFSLNCCTNHFYEIRVKSSDIYISASDTGELCTCGDCIYELTYSDQNPEKKEYHIHMSCFDTIVSEPTNIISNSEKENDIDVYFDLYSSKLFVSFKNISIFNQSPKLTLIDQQGRIILNSIINADKSSILLTGIRNGIYFARLKYGNNIYVKKILIQK